MLSFKTFALLQLLVSSTVGCVPNNSKQVLKEFAKSSLEVILASPKDVPTTPICSVGRPVKVSTALVPLGGEFQFGCHNEITSGAYLLEWYHENTTIGFCKITENSTWEAFSNSCSSEVYYTGSSCSLRVMNVSSDDFGTYTCQTWKLGKIDSRHSCRLAVVEPTRTSTYAPEYVDAHREDDVTLTCDIPMRDPYMTGHWLIGSTILSTEGSWSKDENTGEWKWTLPIPSAQVKSSGNYTCQLNRGSLYLEKSIVLRVSPAPKNYKAIYVPEYSYKYSFSCPVNETDDLTELYWRNQNSILSKHTFPGYTNNFCYPKYEASYYWDTWNLQIGLVWSDSAGEYICSCHYKGGRVVKYFIYLNVTAAEPHGFWRGQFTIR